MKRFPDIFLLSIGIGTILCCSLSATGVFRHKTKQKIERLHVVTPDTGLVQTGDLIFRDGKSFISNALKRFNLRDQRFSHAGIIHMRNDEAWVYHCIGGEGNPDNRMRLEKLSSFCSPEEINRYAIFRPGISVISIASIDSLANQYYQSGMLFDTKFDLGSSDKMYCTELIYDLYSNVLRDDNFISLSNIAGTSYIACDNIFLNPEMTEIFNHTYTNSQ